MELSDFLLSPTTLLLPTLPACSALLFGLANESEGTAVKDTCSNDTGDKSIFENADVKSFSFLFGDLISGGLKGDLTF
jgi:hypothetical protein